MSSPIHQLSSRRFNSYPGQRSFENFSDFEALVSRRPFTSIVVPRPEPSRPSSSSSSNLLPRRARTAPPRLVRKRSTGEKKEAPKQDELKEETTENFSQYLKNRHYGSLGSLCEAETDTSEPEQTNENEVESKEEAVPGAVKEPRMESARSTRSIHTRPSTPQITGPTIEKIPDSSKSSRRQVISDPRLVYDREAEQNTILDDVSVQTGWLKRRNSYGFPYYTNQRSGEETWEKPIVLPTGWESRKDPSLFAYYLDCRTGFITWEKPEVLPFGWERQTSDDGRLYYLHYHSSLSSCDKPDSNTLHTLQASS